jgi:hypothetical protein
LPFFNCYNPVRDRTQRKRHASIVAVAFYYLAIAAVILIGIIAGRCARSTFQAMLLGLVGNLVIVGLLFCATILFAILSPGRLDSDDMGLRLGALLLFGSALGVVAAFGGRRRASKASARLF